MLVLLVTAHCILGRVFGVGGIYVAGPSQDKEIRGCNIMLVGMTHIRVRKISHGHSSLRCLTYIITRHRLCVHAEQTRCGPRVPEHHYLYTSDYTWSHLWLVGIYTWLVHYIIC